MPSVAEVDRHALDAEQLRDPLDRGLERVRERQPRDRLADDGEQRARPLELEAASPARGRRRGARAPRARANARQPLQLVLVRRGAVRVEELERADRRRAELQRRGARGAAGERVPLLERERLPVRERVLRELACGVEALVAGGDARDRLQREPRLAGASPGRRVSQSAAADAPVAPTATWTISCAARTSSAPAASASPATSSAPPKPSSERRAPGGGGLDRDRELRRREPRERDRAGPERLVGAVQLDAADESVAGVGGRVQHRARLCARRGPLRTARGSSATSVHDVVRRLGERDARPLELRRERRPARREPARGERAAGVLEHAHEHELGAGRRGGAVGQGRDDLVQRRAGRRQRRDAGERVERPRRRLRAHSVRPPRPSTLPLVAAASMVGPPGSRACGTTLGPWPSRRTTSTIPPSSTPRQSSARTDASVRAAARASSGAAAPRARTSASGSSLWILLFASAILALTIWNQVQQLFGL